MISLLDSLVSTHWSRWISYAGAPRPLDWVAISNGGTFYYDNVGLFGLLEGDPVLLAKVCRLPVFSDTLCTEYKALRIVQATLNHQAAVVVPKPLALAHNGRDIALVTDFIKGESLLFGSRRQLWRNATRLHQVSIEAAQALRFLHTHLAVPGLPEGESAPGWEDAFCCFREMFPLMDHEKRELKFLSEQIAACYARPLRYTLLQGDFWHGNLIIRPGKPLAVVDWQFARWSPDASLDVYLYLLAGALSAVRPGPEIQRARQAAQQVLAWQSDLVPAYLEAYGSPDGYTLLPPRAGMLACCIEMATRPALIFKGHHPNDGMWYTLFAELRRLLPQD